MGIFSTPDVIVKTLQKDLKERFGRNTTCEFIACGTDVRDGKIQNNGPTPMISSVVLREGRVLVTVVYDTWFVTVRIKTRKGEEVGEYLKTLTFCCLV